MFMHGIWSVSDLGRVLIELSTEIGRHVYACSRRIPPPHLYLLYLGGLLFRFSCSPQYRYSLSLIFLY